MVAITWLSDFPLGEWDGVTTDDAGRVTELALIREKLKGEIPAEVGNLANLRKLTLAFNDDLTRADTTGAGQPLQPDNAGAHRQ